MPEKVNIFLELISGDPQEVTLDSRPLPFLMREGKSLEPGLQAALEMQRFSYLKGMHLREVSPGFPSTFKEEQSFSRNSVYKDRVQRLWSLGPEEISSQAVLCKSGLIEEWTKSLFQAKKGRRRRIIIPFTFGL